MNPLPIGPAEVEELNEAPMHTDLLSKTVAATVDWQSEMGRLDFEIRQWEHHQRMAKLFVQSGCFADVKGSSLDQAIAQAMVKIELGRSMGFGAAESMKGIDLIQGRPAIAAELRAARMAAAGFHWIILEDSEKRAAIEVKFGGRKLGEIQWTIEEAQRMGLTGKDNWKKSPGDMLWARCITRAQRRYAPHVLSTNILSKEEAMDLDVVAEATVIQTATTAKAKALAEKLENARAVPDAM